MEIKAADVLKLRKATGAGMMDCKNALSEAEGNFERATEIIRERGKLVASKRADREATEGVVLAEIQDSFGAVTVLNCETDFVAKNEGFIALTKKLLDFAVASKTTDLPALLSSEIEGRTVEAYVTEQVGIIGEKLTLSFFEKIEAPYLVKYIHPGNRLATVVGFSKPIDPVAAKDVAMQVAAMNPVAVDKDDVPKSIADKEFEIAKEKFRLEGKAGDILDKIAMGALQKFYKESTLLNQAFIKDNKLTVRDYLASVDKSATVTGFVRYGLGE
jgi:elongation factor Ts